MLFDQQPREIVQFLKRNKILGASERYRVATLAEAYYLSRQYEGMYDWNADKPIKLRRPRVIVPLFRTAVDRLIRFTWGAEGFPSFVIAPTRNDDDPAGADEVGPELDVDDAKDLTTFCSAMLRAGRLGRCAREYSTKAVTTTSCAVIVGARGGFLTWHIEPGKHCTPSFDPLRPWEVAQLEVLYQFEREESNGSGGVTKRQYWYRRLIDAQQDITFNLVPVRVGIEPNWAAAGINPDASVKHEMGFCPVRWVRTRPISEDPIDGTPIIDPSLYPMLDRINYTLSQRDRAVEYFQDPQWVRFGVSQGQREQLNKHPGKIWDLENKDKSDLKILEMEGKGQEAADKHLNSLSERFAEAVGLVLSQNDKLTGDISGRVLEYLHAPMIAVAGELREDLGDDAFAGVINLCLRVVTAIAAKGEDIFIQGVGKAVKLISKAQGAGAWLDFPVVINWGPHFKLTSQEKVFEVQAATSAEQAGYITKHTATATLQALFPIEDVDAEREAADQERAENGENADMMSGGRPGGDQPPPKTTEEPIDRGPGKP